MIFIVLIWSFMSRILFVFPQIWAEMHLALEWFAKRICSIRWWCDVTTNLEFPDPRNRDRVCGIVTAEKTTDRRTNQPSKERTRRAITTKFWNSQLVREKKFEFIAPSEQTNLHIKSQEPLWCVCSRKRVQAYANCNVVGHIFNHINNWRRWTERINLKKKKKNKNKRNETMRMRMTKLMNHSIANWWVIGKAAAAAAPLPPVKQ